jgi:hypothetical protein
LRLSELRLGDAIVAMPVINRRKVGTSAVISGGTPVAKAASWTTRTLKGESQRV